MDPVLQDILDISKANNVHAGDIFEEIIEEIANHVIQPGDTAIDVGVLTGRHLFHMQETVGPTGHIYAFEPLPDYAGSLRNRIESENIQNITLIEKALGLVEQKSTFHYFTKQAGYSGLQRRNTPFSDEEGGLKIIEVQQVLLDKTLPDCTSCNFMKLDIEGGEFFALNGGKELLNRTRPVIVFESDAGGNTASSKLYGYTKEEFFDFFQDLNMSLFYLSGAPFGPKNWQSEMPCWELIAIPNEKTTLLKEVPLMAQKIISQYQ